MVADSGATLSCFMKTGKQSTKSFHTSFGQVANTTKEAQLHTNFREPAQSVDIVPGLKHSSLLSISKIVEANYLTLFTPEEVQIFNEDKTMIVSMTKPILPGWKNPQIGLCRVPILPKQSKKIAQNRKWLNS